MKKKIGYIFLALIFLPCLFLMSACGGSVDFKINFVVDGVVYDTIETSGNTTISMPNDPEKQGYTFDGWYWDKDIWNEPFTANSLLNTPLKKDMNVYAKFSFVHNHTMQHVNYLAPTCVASGNIEYYHCTSCGVNYSDSLGQNVVSSVVLASLGHIKGSYVETKQATCIEKGTEVSSCTRCYEVLDTRDIPAMGHTPSNWTELTPATCTSDGISIRTCNVCLDELDRKAIPSTGHKFGTWFTQKDATYYETGIEKRNCTKCNHYETRDIPKIVVDIEVPTSVSVEFGIIKWNGYSPFGFDVVVNGINQIVKANQLETTLKSDDYNEIKVASIDVDGTKSAYAELKDFIVNAPITNLHYTDDGSNVTFTWDSPSDLYDYTFIVGENENTVNKTNHSYTVTRSSLASGSIVSVYVQGLDSANFYPSKKNTITLQQLDAPNLFIDKLNIKWSDVAGADNYKVEALTTETITDTTYSYDGANAGEHTITVTAFGEDYLNNSSTYTFNKLTRPEITIENNIVTWNAIAGQVRYATLINDNETKFMGYSYPIENTEDEYDIYLYASPVPANTMMSDRVIISKFTYGEYSNVYYGTITNNTPTYTKVIYDNYIYIPNQYIDNVNLSDVNSSITLIACKVPTGLAKTLVTNIIIPNGTTEIVADAFRGCTNAISVSMPESVISIGSSAFGGCSSLIEMTLPFVGSSASATSASSSTLFGYVFGTSSYTGGTGTIQYYDSSSYKTYYIPSSLQKVTILGGNILYGAFYNCSMLTEITIKDGVTSMESEAFYGCTSLTGVYITDLDKWASIDFSDSTSNPLYYAKNLYLNGVLVTDATLTNATKISSYTFYSCTSLTSITIPENVTSISDSAFYGCSSLTGVYITDLDKWVSIDFADSYSNPLCYAKNLYLNGELVTDATLTNATTISAYAFCNCTSLTSITIPESVTNIGCYAFDNCTSLTSITIPESVISIGSNAFYNCTSLTGVYITDLDKWASIEFGNYYANPLSYAKNLYLNGKLVTDANISNVTKISAYAFYNCTSLISIAIPESVASIGKYAFYNCTGLKTINYNAIYCVDLSYDNYVFYRAGLNGDGITVNIGVNVEKIPAYLFYPSSSSTCSPNIISIVFVENCKCESIEDRAFDRCTSLTGVYITDLDKWTSMNFVNYTNPLRYAKNLYLNGKLVTNATLTSATKISAYAFYNCTSLTSITISASVTSIGDSAFYSCTGLKSVTFAENSKCESINESAFAYCSSLTSITIPESVTSIRSSVFSGCSSLVEMTLPFVGSSASVTSASSSTVFGYIFGAVSYTGGTKTEQYYDSSSRTTYYYYIPSSLRKVTILGGNILYHRAFYGCSMLTEITIPKSVTSIWNSAFSKCTGLKTVTFEENSKCECIGEQAFYNCTSLTSITIPESVTSIERWAFSYCTSLINIVVDKNNKIYDSRDNCNAIIETATSTLIVGCLSTIIPNTATTIGNYAFYGCTSRTSITIPENIIRIRNYAFYNCTGLVEINYNAILCSDDLDWYNYVFHNAGQNGDGITVNIGANVENIPTCLFYPHPSSDYSPKITSVVFAENSRCERIGEQAFYNCTSLTSITIPESVTGIGSSAFSNCTSLTRVYYEGGVDDWSGIKIYSSNSSLTNATRYYYSEEEPTDDGNYWHYVDGVVTEWEKDEGEK